MSIFDYVFGDTSRNSPRDADPTLQTAQCMRCCNPFTYRNRRSGKQRDSIEYEPLRKKLMITDASVEPVVCDPCFIDIMNHETAAPMTTGMPGSQTPPVLRLLQQQQQEQQ